MAEVSAHVVARFPDRAGSGSALLTIEAEPGGFFGSDRHLLISPPGVATSIATDVGEVRLGSIKPIAVPGGTLQISGGEVTIKEGSLRLDGREVAFNHGTLRIGSGGSGTLPRLPSSHVDLRVLFAFDSATGAPIGVNARLNPLTGVVTLDQSCHAVVAYSAYQSSAQQLIYSPLIERIPTSQPGVSGMKVTLGVVAAFRPPDTLVTYQVPLSAFEGNAECELYRIVSDVVTNASGEFEKPPGYPTSGAYTNPVASPPLDLEGTLVTQRVHEICTMDDLGRPFIKEYHRENLPPYFGITSFKPVKRLMPSSVPEDKYGKDVVLKAKNIVAARGLGKL